MVTLKTYLWDLGGEWNALENEALISVIVPVWNAHEYLNRCIESILNQTYGNLEILLVDDGSTDDSLAICRMYEKMDTRIRVFHKENGGQGSARNLALDNCCGEYVGFVDNDDWILPTMYERLYNIITKYDVNIARCDDAQSQKEIEETNSVREEVTDHDVFYKYLFCDIWGGHVTDRLFKRELIGKNRFPQSKTIEDMRFIRLLLPNVTGEAHVNEKLYYYTVRDDNTSFRYAKTFVNSYERAEEYQSRYEEAIEKNPDYLDILLPKATTFACGSMKILRSEHKKDSNEYNRMKAFLKDHKHEILKNKGIAIKYKIFVAIV